MSVTKEQLESRYKDFESAYLVDLLAGELTELASVVARNELLSRGLSDEKIDELVSNVNQSNTVAKYNNSIYANANQRIFARAIDTAIFITPLLLTKLGSDSAGFIVAIALIYFLFQDSIFFGKSVGKFIVGITVRVERTGKACSFWRSFIRNFILLVGGVIDVVFLLGKSKKRLGDYAAGTIVVNDVNFKRQSVARVSREAT